jgi:hypothetical protein
VGSRAGLDAVAERKNFCPCRDSKPSRLARSLVSLVTELSRLLVYIVPFMFTYISNNCVTCSPVRKLSHFCFARLWIVSNLYESEEELPLQFSMYHHECIVIHYYCALFSRSA